MTDLTKQAAYWQEPLTFEFEAHIVDKRPRDGGQFEVRLARSYFYPTGGGQGHDTGSLGQARVIDVAWDEAGNIVHTVDRDIAGTTVPARIDAERRLDHMQHHSAQHILSGAIEAVLGLETLSAHISADPASTIDVPLAELDRADLEQVEHFANGTVFENRAIKSYFVTDDRLDTVPFRRPPKVTGQIRVVEIDAFDYSACGGTHCPQTGTVGLIKILRTEVRNKKLRFYFAAGRLALHYFQQDHHIVSDVGRALSAGPDDIIKLVDQQSEQLRLAQKELKRLSQAMIGVEARELAAQAGQVDGRRLVTAMFEGRPAGELRELARLLQAEPDVVAVLAGYEGQKLSLVASSGDETGLSAKELLNRHLSPLGLRGGGDDRIAQGGGPATEEAVSGLFTQTRDYLSG